MTALAIIAGVLAYAVFLALLLWCVVRVKVAHHRPDQRVEAHGIGGAAERTAVQDHRGQGLSHTRSDRA